MIANGGSSFANPMPKASAHLSADTSSIVLIDPQPELLAEVKSIDRAALERNIVALVRSARTFDVPIAASLITGPMFSGDLIGSLRDQLDDQPLYHRSRFDAWESGDLSAVLRLDGRCDVIFSALWTEICLTQSVLSALAEGYRTFVAVDCVGSPSALANETALQRLIQGGATPIMWRQALLEWNSAWDASERSSEVLCILSDADPDSEQRFFAHWRGVDESNAAK